MRWIIISRGGRRIQVLLAAFLLACISLWSTQEAWAVTAQKVDEDPEGNPYVAGELIVVYESGVETKAAEELPEEVEGEVEEELPAVDAQVIEFPEVKQEGSEAEREQDLQQKKEALERQPGVVAADYNYLRAASFVPDDPRFEAQYGLDKIGAPQAWNRTPGDPNVRISIVDTGIDVGHPDLGSKVVAQRSFVGPVESSSGQDNAGHGTAVAGVAAAITDNARGVAGTCPDCSLMAAKVGNKLRSISAKDEIEGINWSTDNGADVINISLGGAGAIEAEKRAVDRARSEGIVVVAAAGNEDTNEPSYPAAYPSAISVAATNRNDRKADFSNFGRTIDVAAPGVDILTTDIRRGDGFGSGNYSDPSGTSFSSPFAAGVAGLLVAQGRSADEVRSRLESTAEDIGPGGKDSYYGNGRIDAAAAVGAVAQTPPPEGLPNTAPKIKAGRPGPGAEIKDRKPTIRATVKDAQTDLEKSDITLTFDGKETGEFGYSGGRDRLSYEPSGKLDPGRHSVKIVARDEQGRTTTEKWSFRAEEPRGDPTTNVQFGLGFPFSDLPGEFPFGMFR